MCGRYAASRNPDDLVEEFEIERLDSADLPGPSWNVAPTDAVAAVLVRKGHEDPEHPERQLRAVRWGLVPSWSKDAKGAARLINARVETVAEKPAFRKAFVARRCLLPADGYFEWYVTDAGAKQPFFITRTDGRSLAMAGLYEIWRDPAAPEDAPRLWTATVITTSAQDELGHIHDRMPMMLEPESWEHWLDPTRSEPEELRGLLQPAMPGMLEARPVSTAVGNVRNNGPELVEPIAPADGETLF